MKNILPDVKAALLADKGLLTLVAILSKDHAKYLAANYIEEVFLRPEEFGGSEDEFKAFSGMLESLVTKILRAFHKTEVFPSPEVTYSITYQTLKSAKDAENKVTSIVDDLERFGLTNKSLIVHPLSDFGFQRIGAVLLFSQGDKEIFYSYKDFVVFPQANSLNAAKANIRRAIKDFKLSSYKLDEDLLDHFNRSRRLEWLVRNPLLIFQVRLSSADHFENRYYITRLLEKHLSLLYVSKCASDQNEISKDDLLSTRSINNFQTYDQHHYLVLKNYRKKLIPECVPLHWKLSRVLDTFRLGIEMPFELDKGAVDKISKIEWIVTKVYTELFSGGPGKHSKSFYENLRRSIGYFVRSYQAEYEEDAVLQLCVAFELLFAEGKIEDVSSRVANAIFFLVKVDRERAVKEFRQLYDSRSGVAHEGATRRCDMPFCRALYLDMLTQLSSLIKKNELRPEEDGPVGNYMKRFASGKLGFFPELK